MKALSLSIVSVVLFGLMQNSAQASGFKCESEEGYRVKLFNHVNPKNGTRTPAALIVSSEEEGTLLVRKGIEIRKSTRINSVRYTVDADASLDLDLAIVQINFKEGIEVLAAGETVDGQLILTKGGNRTVMPLVCERYLKHQ